jgi:heme/copper-type cytochrome/quinol oxidase subunit 2
MFSQPSLSGQPKPDTNINSVKKAVKTILILVFVVVIVILLSLAVILSGRTGINPMQTPSPAPTNTPTATHVLTSSVIVVSVGFLRSYNPEVRLGLKTAKKGRLGAHMRLQRYR